MTGLKRRPVLVPAAAPADPAEVLLSLDTEHENQLRTGLELVTGPRGTAARAFWNLGFRDFAGKSGTAEDSGSQQHVLFVTYSPQVEPQVLAAVILEDGESGSLEAGPIARDAVLSALERD